MTHWVWMLGKHDLTAVMVKFPHKRRVSSKCLRSRQILSDRIIHINTQYEETIVYYVSQQFIKRTKPVMYIVSQQYMETIIWQQ